MAADLRDLHLRNVDLLLLSATRRAVRTCPIDGRGTVPGMRSGRANWDLRQAGRRVSRSSALSLGWEGALTPAPSRVLNHQQGCNMAHFQKPSGAGPGYDVDGKAAPGSVWRMQVPEGSSRPIALWGGDGLTVRSNNPAVLPNSFSERASGDLRILNLTGAAVGTSMLEAGRGNRVWISLQVQVVAAQAAAARSLSQAGVNFIARHEAFRAQLYDDAAGHATVGYGHLVHRGRVGTNAAAEAPYTRGLTQQDATRLLQQDAATHVTAVNAAVRVPLSQNQLDALVSFSFNVGAGAMRGSGLVRVINGGQFTAQQIQVEFSRWVHADGRVLQGLVNRRRDEANLFSHGQY